ncbi:MAG: hypothetical protein ACHQ4J_03110 [Candidatus Binatia bacterium]
MPTLPRDPQTGLLAGRRPFKLTAIRGGKLSPKTVGRRKQIVPTTGFLLRIHKRGLDRKLQELREYAGALEGLLVEAGRQMKADLDASVVGVPEDGKAFLLDCPAADLSMFDDAFPRILRYSLFSHSVALLEFGLLDLAHIYERALGLKLSKHELRDKGITRAKTYLQKVPGAPFPETSVYWNSILALNAIRNLVVHNNGLYRKDQRCRDKIDRLMEQWNGLIFVDDVGRFQLSAGFVEKALNTTTAFLKELFANLERVSEFRL